MKTGVRFQVSRHGGPSADVAFQLPGGRFMILTFLCALCVFVVRSTAFAQSTPSQVEPNNTTGTPPFGSFGGQNENINLANGNLNISIPLFSFGGRGMGLSMNAVYDSKLWHPSQWFDETILQYVYDWDTQDNGTLGWNVTGLPALTAIQRCTQCDDPLTRVNWYDHFIVTLPDGSRHEFPGVSTLSGYPKISDTNDGALLRINMTDPNDAVVRTTDGLELHFNPPPVTNLKYIVDRNGNKLLFNYNGGNLVSITDVAGRQIVSFSYLASQTVMTVSDSNGTQQNYIFNWQQITKTNVAFQTPFLVKDVVLYFGVTSIILPTGQSYSFEYNEYGELIKITYPTGVYSRYDYGRFTARHFYEGVNSDEPADFREVTARHVSPDGVTEHTTTYTPTVDGTVFNNTKMTITDALGNKSEHFFTSTFAGTVHPPREIKTILYDGQTSALVQTDRTFSAFPRAYPTSTTTTLLDKGMKNKVEMTYETYTPTYVPPGETTPIEDGNVIVHSEWDYVPSSSSFPLVPLRKRVRTYLQTNPVNGIDYRTTSRFLFSLVSSESIQDGIGAQLARTDFVYDNYAGLAGPLVDRPTITGHDTVKYSAGYTTRGNLTDAKRWLNTTGGTIDSYAQYDIAGSVVRTIDPRGNTTTFNYTDNFTDGISRNTFAYQTSATNPLGQTVSTRYFFATGLPSEVTDANGTTTTFEYNDPLSHLTRSVRGANTPLSNQTAINYNYGTRIITTTSDRSAFGDNVLKAEQEYDGLGRLIESRTFEGPGAYIATRQRYDAVERLSQVSNPFRLGESPVFTTTAYDGLSRVRTVTTPDGAAVTTNYLGNETTVTDQAGKNRRSITDALGRLTQVIEDPFGLAYQTNYAYDLLDNLTTVNQGVQTRTFTYDSMKRLTSATNPESGTISYQYDANSNLTAKADARGVSTSFSYDSLNRVTSKTYTDSTPAVSYFYDANQPASIPVGFSRGFSVGKLTAVTSGVTTNFYGFDALGRVVQSFQRTDGVDYGFSYAYNLVGALTSMTYPSGRVVSHGYDGAGRIASVSGVKGATSTTYASSFSYAPHGAVGSVTLGNGLIESTTFNNRLQPANISLGSLLSLAYNYGTSNNNGNALSMTITPGTGQTPFVQTFGYDALNRLQSGTETVNATQSWNQTFGYDRYGNRWFDPATSGAVMGPISSQTDINAANNRIQKAGYSYDAAGNMTAEPGKSYTFDGENKIVTALVGSSTSNYVYDGDGRRVKKATPQGTTVMVYDAAGQIIAEYSDAPAAGPGGTQYATADHLGTPRLWTNASGQVIPNGRHDYLPFGEELFAGIGSRSGALSYPPSAQADGQRNQFTQKERDNETGLDYFLARYYSSGAGRFISPDEFGGGPVEFFAAAASANPTFYADLTNPQTLNKYQYSFNNPLRYIDPDGHDPTDPDDGTKPQKRLNSEQESLVKVAAGTIVCGPLCGFINLLIDPPAAGDDSEPPTLQQSLKSEGTAAAIGLIVPGGRLLSAAERSTIGKVQNILAEQLDSRTLQAAAKEVGGEVVARKSTGEAFNHIPKVQQGLQGLKNANEALNKSLKDPTLNPLAKATLRRNSRITREAIQSTEKFFRKHRIPEMDNHQAPRA